MSSLSSLFNDPNFASEWVETTAHDGIPLIMNISQENGGLFLQFTKNGALWASGTASICGQNGQVSAHINGNQIQLGSAAPFLLHMALGGGATFSLNLSDPESLQISTTGWSSHFAPR
jgi:hypothetical protein